MPPYINILDKERLDELLAPLEPGTLPLWGKLKAQNMIEHLIEAVEFTNGKKMARLENSTREAYKEKQEKVRDDFEIPKGVTGPLADNSNKIRFKDLATAISRLKEEIETFEDYFKTPGQTSIHGAFGPMNYREWILWHGKHFAHHFRQFGLLNDYDFS